MRSAIKAGLLMNQHRGIDAAGYCIGHTVEGEHKVSILRSDQTPSEFVDTHLLGGKRFVEGNVLTLGAHTRAATLGAPEVLENNHPVSYAGIHVTHNGSIRNHEHIRSQIPEQIRDSLAEVDSAVLPYLFAFKNFDPTDHSALENFFAQFAITVEGSCAMHVQFEKYPGVSLFVRGEGSPLTVGVAEGAIVYGSEVESAASVAQALSLPDVTYFSLDVGTVLLVVDGAVAHTLRFIEKKVASYTNFGHKKHVPEWFRYSADGSIFESDHYFAHWSRSNAPKSVLVGGLSKKVSKHLLVMSNSDIKKEMKASVGVKLLADASMLVVYDNDVTKRYYAIFGDSSKENVTEVVMSKNGTILDIFYWDVPAKKRSLKKKWLFVKKKEEKKKEEGEKAEGKPIVFANVSKIVKVDWAKVHAGSLSARNRFPHIVTQNHVVHHSSPVEQDEDFSAFSSDSLFGEEYGAVAGAKDKGITVHSRNPSWVSWYDFTCDAHSQLFTQHDVTIVCEDMQTALLQVLDQCKTLEDVAVVFRGTEGTGILRMNSQPKSKVCDIAHQFYVTNVLWVNVDSMVYSLPAESRCQNCTMIQRVVYGADSSLSCFEWGISTPDDYYERVF